MRMAGAKTGAAVALVTGGHWALLPTGSTAQGGSDASMCPDTRTRRTSTRASHGLCAEGMLSPLCRQGD